MQKKALKIYQSVEASGTGRVQRLIKRRGEGLRQDMVLSAERAEKRRHNEMFYIALTLCSQALHCPRVFGIGRLRICKGRLTWRAWRMPG
ncbi:hypothetical protein EVAR_18302_1 [Eumeta japonica]|uniref:Uncharacterized protein n=1 Tax=Eumeta variegata TaxID=151549 RepID=A0A4C1VA70_EUMVA|nr:hypothetical protein EVAR_18302_1 [Eumeta japonica]